MRKKILLSFAIIFSFAMFNCGVPATLDKPEASISSKKKALGGCPDGQNCTNGYCSSEPADPLSALSDEFNNAATIGNWSIRHMVENTPVQYTALDINQTISGALTILPTSSAWYQDGVAPYLYKRITGNFIAMTSVRAVSASDPNSAPAAPRIFQSAGILARNPASGSGSQNWLVLNVGRQNGVIGTESKTTVNSSSVLTITPGSHISFLLMCRVGSNFYLYRRDPNETQWTEIFDGQGNRYVRADLPQTLQIGLMTNAWNLPAGQTHIRGEFDYVRFARPQTVSDCTTMLQP